MGEGGFEGGFTKTHKLGYSLIKSKVVAGYTRANTHTHTHTDYSLIKSEVVAGYTQTHTQTNRSTV